MNLDYIFENWNTYSTMKFTYNKNKGITKKNNQLMH